MKYPLSKEKPMGLDAPMYVYATEMVEAYYRVLNVKNKKVLTIVGSGDQVLNAISMGAKAVWGFDLNKNALHMVNLKFAAVKALSYPEFMEYFGDKPNMGFSYELYTKIRSNLCNSTMRFFDDLYKSHHFSGLNMVKSEIFRQREGIKVSAKQINQYLKSRRTYMSLKNKIGKIAFKFIRSDARDVWAKTSTKFDIINLSNVPNYVVQRLNAKDRFATFYKNVLLKLRKMLSKNGALFFYSYSYSAYPNSVATKMPIASSDDALSYMKNRNEFKVRRFSFKGIAKSSDRITVLYKK